MRKLENEQIITESDNKRIVLTSHRIRYNESGYQNANMTSIMLKQVSSIEITYESKLIYLIIGVITLPIIVGLLFLLLYYFSRKHVVVISSTGGAAIHFETKGMKREALNDFIDNVEEAINKGR